MHRPSAVLAVLAATVGLGLVPAAAPVAAAPVRSAATAVEGDPLQVELDTLTPGVVPTRGPIRVSGTVTNVDTETWTTVNLYAFISSTPLTTPAEVAAAAALPEDAPVGERIVEEGDATDTVDEIAPGDSVSFSFEVPRRDVPVDAPGVYWFGVQALGQGPDGRDLAADGRVRTLLPLVDTATAPLDLAVVVPLRRRIELDPDGRVADLPGWRDVLSPGGRLRSLVDLGYSASSRAVTYVVDPALVTTVQRLAAGNPARSLRPTLPADAGQGADDGASPAEPGASDTPGDDPSGTDGATQGADDESGAATPGADADGDGMADDEAGGTTAGARELDPLTTATQQAAQDWLTRLTRALAGHEVLALPYGDLDVAAAADHAPGTLAEARTRSAEVMAGLGIPARPVVASPGGYLDAAGLALAAPDDTVLLSDLAVGTQGSEGSEGAEGSEEATVTPAVVPTVRTDGVHRVVVTASAATSGPGPGEPRSLLSLRQRVLAEAALRALGDAGPGSTRQPLAVALPSDWNPDGSSGFFSALDLDWLDLVPVSTLASDAATPLTTAELRYPRSQARSELPEPVFDAADDLAAAGGRLQNLLTRNDQVARVVADEALTTLSYTARSEPLRARTAAVDAQRWITDRLGRVQVEAPKAFTMTGTTGNFAATVVNGLAQPVTVSLRASSDEGLSVARPRQVQIPASSRTRVLLRATAPDGGIHRVSLRLVDADGAPLGDSDVLTVRSLRVSNVIWLFFGAAGVLLLGAIVFRLVRRVLAARRRRRGRGGPDDPDGPGERSGPSGAHPDDVRDLRPVGDRA